MCVVPQADPVAGQTYAGGIAPARQPGAESGVSNIQGNLLGTPIELQANPLLPCLLSLSQGSH